MGKCSFFTSRFSTKSRWKKMMARKDVQLHSGRKEGFSARGKHLQSSKESRRSQRVTIDKRTER